MNTRNLIRGSARQAGARFATLALVVVASAAVSAAVSAQAINDDGAKYAVTYTSANVAQDFTIPASTSATYINLEVRGAEGGEAKAGSCTADGGSPVRAKATFVIGSGVGELLPGGKLRFVIGERGEDGSVGGSASVVGAGAGGSGILYQRDAVSSWELLMAAGGGGGAYQGNFLGACVDKQTGGDAKTGTSGGGWDGSGGDDGEAGKSWDQVVDVLSGGGGGSIGDADMAIGGDRGYPAGGNGGTDSLDGGWGYGGGGGGNHAAGGGGGYSGGSGGEDYGLDGKGGGSFINEDWSVSSSLVVSGASNDGIGYYQCLDQLGTEACADAAPIDEGGYSGDTSLFADVGVVAFCTPGMGDFGRAAWFSFTNNYLYPVRVTASTCPTAATTNARLTVLESCADEAGPFLACGTPCGPPGLEQVIWDMQPGETHLIRVLASPIFWFGPVTKGGPYKLSVNTEILPATNDTCSTAVAVTEGPGKLGTLWGVTPDAEDVACTTTHDDSWFVYENTTGEDVCVTARAVPIFSYPHIAMEVKGADCFATPLVCAAPAAIEPVSLSWGVAAGASSLFRVANQDSGSGGIFGLELTLSTDIGLWHDLGNALAPTGGNAPSLTGAGNLCAGATVTFSLSDAVPGSTAWFVLGLSEINAAFKGGVLVPNPDIVLSLPTGASGAIALAAPWPAGLPSSLPMAVQYWVQDPAGPVGFTASNALRMTTP